MRNFKIAVTGGIGSGKSTVCKILKDKKYTVVNADKIAKNVLFSPDIQQTVANEFSLSLDERGNFDKSELAAKVFSDKTALAKLNAIIHPPTLKRLFWRLNITRGIAFAEIPLLFETGTQNLFDHVLIIKRNTAARVQSVVARDGISAGQVKMRIKNQYDYEKKPEIAHTVIYNDNDLISLNKQVEDFLNAIVQKTR